MDGGSINREIDCHDRAGKSIRIMIITSHDQVEIGGWTFNREHLLAALGLPQAAALEGTE